MFSDKVTQSRKIASALAALLLGLVLLPNAGNAAGAFAVGKVSGFTFGLATNQPSDADAKDQAVDSCRKTPDAVKTPALRDDCKVIETFSNKCVAVAWDPAPNYPNVGVGWALADDLETTKHQAIAKCETTVKPGRSGTCVVSRSLCDGSAK